MSQEPDNWVEDLPEGEVKTDSGFVVPELDIPPAYQDGLNLLEHLLHDKSTIYTSKILTLMLTYKIKADDPMFLLLLSISELELILVNTPMAMVTFGEELLDQMEEIFQGYFGEDANTTQRLEVATAEYMALVANDASQIVESVSQKQFYGNVSAIARTIVPVLGTLCLTFGLGVFGTLHFAKVSTKALVGSGKLTVEQYQLLKWAESKEGTQAKLISDLNGSYIGKKCQKDAQDLSVKFSFGNNELKSGYCVLMIDRP